MPQPERTTHAVILPWWLSLGPLVTWCGALAHGSKGPRGARRLPEDAMVAMGEAPTCAACLDGMRRAQKHLNDLLGESSKGGATNDG